MPSVPGLQVRPFLRPIAFKVGGYKPRSGLRDGSRSRELRITFHSADLSMLHSKHVSHLGNGKPELSPGLLELLRGQAAFSQSGRNSRVSSACRIGISAPAPQGFTASMLS